LQAFSREIPAASKQEARTGPRTFGSMPRPVAGQHAP
jgi:hypothetical protein